MKLNDYLNSPADNPFESLVPNGGMTAIFRTISCIGDSLASGEHELTEMGERRCIDYYDYSWGQFMARDTGATVYNMSRGGMTAKWFETFAHERGFYDEKYKSSAYIIALGVNDVSQILNGEYELGTISDIDMKNWANNKPTFAGYYGRIIAKMKYMSPDAKFFLMTIPRGIKDEARTALYDSHAALLREIAQKTENCYVLDFRKYAPVYDEEFRKRFFLSGHMNAAGYRLTALMTESCIDSIVRSNYPDFAQTALIGKYVRMQDCE